MTDLCPSCREPLDYPSGDGCAAMNRHSETLIAPEGPQQALLREKFLSDLAEMDKDLL